jgi:hypothetical protein
MKFSHRAQEACGRSIYDESFTVDHTQILGANYVEIYSVGPAGLWQFRLHSELPFR